MMNWWLLCTGLAVHLVFFYSIFDIYFTSPLVHGMTPQTHPLPAPAKRLVLFVADGLRADRLFELDDSGHSRAPFIRSIIEEKGTWGVSHTHVPTESRPGHVALIAGFYEDVSAVAKGWKENPVEFDSLFNKSRYTWSWGSPDILPIFAKGKTEDAHIHMQMYPAGDEDFAGADSSKLDTWVFDNVQHFFEAARNDKDLLEKLQQDKLVFFLHLLGIDVNGHSHKPYSRDYLENIGIVDAGVRKMVDTVESFYGSDGQTAYIFTADHGMTNWGSHGAGDPSETLTPLVTWGAGIQSPTSTFYHYPDAFENAWKLGHVQRFDVEQADVCPLMASLIGVPVPVNSVALGCLTSSQGLFCVTSQLSNKTKYCIDIQGLLHPHFLSMPDNFKAEAMFANARQIVSQFDVKMAEKKATTLPPFFTPFKGLGQATRITMLNSITGLVNSGHYKQAIEQSEKLMKLALQGLKYYHNYDRFFLGLSVTFGFFGWMGYISLIIVKKHTTVVPPRNTLENYTPRFLFSEKGLRLMFSIAGSIAVLLLYVQSLPLTHYLYCLLPVVLWHKIAQEFATLRYILHYVLDHGLLWKVLAVAVLGFLGLEIMVAGFFYRELWSLGLIAMAAWPLFTHLWGEHKIISIGWACSCLLVAIFPVLPPVGRDSNYSLVILAGVILTTLTGYSVTRSEVKIFSRAALKDKQDVVLTIFQTAILLLSILVVHSTSSSIAGKEGLPLLNQLFSWTTLALSFLLPVFSSTKLFVRLLSIVMAFSASYLLLSTSHEGLFLAALCLLLFFWLLMEHNLVDRQRKRIEDLDFVEGQILGERERHLRATDLICAYVFIFLLYTAFYGTGNIASINSFDPSSVYCFLTVFNPFVMGALMLWKILIPFLLVTCTFHAIHVSVNVPTQSLFLLVLLMSDFMALNFFFLVRDEGSWLEIGTSISHYVIVMSCICFLLLLLVLSSIFTKCRLHLINPPKKHMP